MRVSEPHVATLRPRWILGAAALFTLGCLCGPPVPPTSDGYGLGRTTGPKGERIALGGPGRLGYLAFTDDGGFVAVETPLQESDPTYVHLYAPDGKPRGKVTLPRAAVRLSRDGAVLGTASAERVLALWDPHDGAPLRQWTAARPLRDVRFSPDGAQVADLDEAGAVRIWDRATGARVARLVADEIETPSFDWSADARTLVVGRSFARRVWDLSAGTSVRTDGDDVGDDPHVSADGRFVLSAPPNRGGVALADLQTGVTTILADGAYHAFSADGTRLLAETRGHALLVVDPRTQARVATLEGACEEITHAVFSPDGTRVLGASEDGSARLWDAVTGAELAGWHLPPDCSPSFNPPIREVAFADDGRTLLLGFYEETIERVVLPPDLASAPRAPATPPPSFTPPVAPPPAPRFGDVVATIGGLGAVAFAPSSTAAEWTLAAAARDGTARIFRGGGVEEPTEIAAWGTRGGPVGQLAWSADGTVLAIGGDDGRVQIVEAATGQVVGSVAIERPSAPDGSDGGTPAEITALAVSADGSLVAAAPRGGVIRVWGRDGVPVRELEGHTEASGRDGRLTTITALQFTDADTLLSASNDFHNASHGNLRRWNARTGARTDLGEGAYLAALSASGDRIAVGTRSRLEVRDARTNAVLHTFEGHAGRVSATAFVGPDTLVSVDDADATLRIWDLATGTPRAAFVSGGERCGDASLSVSGDGMLAAGSFTCAGGAIRVFSLDGAPPRVE